jgi:hypothetical protein
LKASYDQLAIKVMELIVISKIVMERLKISHEEVQEELTRLTNRDPESAEGGSLEPEEAGADGDHQ